MESNRIILKELKLAHVTQPHLSITPSGCTTNEIRTALTGALGINLLLGGDRNHVTVYGQQQNWAAVEDTLRYDFPNHKVIWETH